MLKIKKKNNRKQGGYSALDLLVKQNYNYYIEKIEQANELFLEAEYEKEMKRVEQQKQYVIMLLKEKISEKMKKRKCVCDRIFKMYL